MKRTVLGVAGLWFIIGAGLASARGWPVSLVALLGMIMIFSAATEREVWARRGLWLAVFASAYFGLSWCVAELARATGQHLSVDSGAVGPYVLGLGVPAVVVLWVLRRSDQPR
ncbi:hypothetical protein JK361_25985 [Streptomyces sp. 5-8]|uniref:Integral membrane protein n=1 Tax=Streptomyces musisoli TaxID=2802280 RepID=A0ABS1P6J3_9ACTN|nr:hypothetical protein [Streptomyces musisoli]MBL1107997.1 hypothetical protein [Streptomyces musisoli]